MFSSSIEIVEVSDEQKLKYSLFIVMEYEEYQETWLSNWVWQGAGLQFGRHLGSCMK